MALDRISKSHKRKHRNNKGIKKNILFFCKKNNSLERYIYQDQHFTTGRETKCAAQICVQQMMPFQPNIG